MGPIKAIARGYTRMLNFTGRARRAEYWWFVAWQLVIGMGAAAAFGWQTAQRAATDPAFAAMVDNPDAMEAYVTSLIAPYAIPAAIAYVVLVILPNLSVTIRRLHDTNRSGWNVFMPMLVGIASGIGGGVVMGTAAAGGSAAGVIAGMAAIAVPVLVASVWLLVWLCLPGTNGPNRFGGDPVQNRRETTPAHPALAPQMEGASRDRADVARRAAARDYYKRRVLPSIQKT